jgi:uncharacterized repeat protein (TIGR03837 family)
MDIDILCKVVDNYGDIGFAYRLARALSELPDPPRLRLVVDDLEAFSKLDPSIVPRAERQETHGWEVFAWSDPLAAAGPGAAANDAAAAAFRERPTRYLVECFACGRPDWLEALLFEGSLYGPGPGQGCLIVDLEYLTAEGYAEDFHLMPSLTRSPFVRKSIFLPGFVPGTGGLAMDASFGRALELASTAQGRSSLRGSLLATLGRGASAPAREPQSAPLPLDAADRFWALAFSYERDYARIVADLASFASDRPLLALAAAGPSGLCFRRAWEAAGEPFPALFLPFLPQEDWDALLAACDFSIVRGEDSWSRAALAGRPFLWQAYPQEGRHQLVKIESFLARLGPFLAPPDRDELRRLYLAFNDRGSDGPGTAGKESILPLLRRIGAFGPGFEAFSAELRKNAGLAANLVTFMRDFG